MKMDFFLPTATTFQSRWRAQFTAQHQNWILFFSPLVGWDRHGGRLGMGGGFYDRALSNISDPVLVGLAHENQRVDEVPSERWDITLDYVATDAGLYHCRKQSKF